MTRSRSRMGAAAMPVAALCLVLLATPTPAAERDPPPGVDPLFADDSLVELELQGPFSRIARDRRPEPEERPVRMSWRTAEGETGTLAIEVRPRGKSRRRREVCGFPPLRLNIRQSEADGTLFELQDKLKLVTHCELLGSTVPSQFDFVALELLAYRFLNALTDRSFRVRPVRIVYVEDDGERATHPGFLIEDKDRLAARLGMSLTEATFIDGSAMDADHRTLAEVFQYLIGNTDFSFHESEGEVRCCHNAVQLVDEAGVHYPVPYDFDLAGLVNKPGARPASGLGIRRVTDRRFVGPCRAPEDLNRVLDQVRARRAELEAELADLEGLRDGKRRRTERFLDAFWSTLEDPRRVERDFLERCG